MADQDKHQHVEISDGDHVVAFAEVHTLRNSTQPANAQLHAQAGHLPPGSRASLVDAVLDLPEVQHSDHLQATVPLGDSESLQRLHDRCADMTTRAAGSSALVEADPPGPTPTPTPPPQPRHHNHPADQSTRGPNDACPPAKTARRSR